MSIDVIPSAPPPAVRPAESSDEDDSKTLASSVAITLTDTSATLHEAVIDETPALDAAKPAVKAPDSPQTSPAAPTVTASTPAPKKDQDDDDEDDAEVNRIKSRSGSFSKSTSFPKQYHFKFVSDETASNTNANANTFIEARDISRRRRRRKIERSLYHEQHPHDPSNPHHHHHHHHHDPSETIESAKAQWSDSTESDTDSTSQSRSRSRSRIRTRSRSNVRKLSGGGGSTTGNPSDFISPARDFEPRVAFDTFDNKLATDYTLTLRYTHQDYKYSRMSRTFLCGTDKNKYSENAASWLMRELVQDGDEIVCLRVVDPGTSEKAYRREAESFLEHILAKNVKNKGIAVIMEFAVGKIQDSIMRMIEIYEPSMLVVGTKGRSTTKGFRGLLPGSVSKWCLQHSPIPVIVVKPPNLRQKSKSTREKLLADADHSQYAYHRQSYLEMISSADNMDTVKIYNNNNSSSPNLHPVLPAYLTASTSQSVSNPNLSSPHSSSPAPLRNFSLTSAASVASSGASAAGSSASPTASPKFLPRGNGGGSPVASPRLGAQRSAPASPLLLSSSPSLCPVGSDRKVSRLDLLKSKAPRR